MFSFGSFFQLLSKQNEREKAVQSQQEKTLLGIKDEEKAVRMFCYFKKLNPYTRDITPKHVTSGGIHLHGLAPGQHSSEETSPR